jgi:hypothetical protein
VNDRPIKLMISGRTGSGMSAIAAQLGERYGAACWSRSELMKRIAHALVDGVGDLEELLSRIVPAADQRAGLREDLLSFAVHYEPEQGAPVQLYQDVVDLCQARNHLCFEHELERRIKQAGKHPFVVIDDVKGEVGGAFAYLSGRGYASLRVEAPEEARRRRLLARDGHLPRSERLAHVVETGLDDAAHDFLLNSDTSPERVTAQLDRLVALLRDGFEPGANLRLDS